MRVVLVHDWLTGMRGGEKCLEPACRRWPDAPLFTLIHRPGTVSEAIERHAPLFHNVQGHGVLPFFCRDTYRASGTREAKEQDVHDYFAFVRLLVDGAPRFGSACSLGDAGSARNPGSSLISRRSRTSSRARSIQ